MPAPTTTAGTVAVVTLGCARNEVDSEELAARLAADGWSVVADADDADAVIVNTCAFVTAAKKDSIDTILALADSAADSAAGSGDRHRTVVAAGCLAERYGSELAAELPEADAVLGFDDYVDIGARLRSVMAGQRYEAHTPRDRRLLLPISPVERGSAGVTPPGHAAAPADEQAPGLPEWAGGPRSLRRRLSSGPVAPLKLASGCDRRCSFCAIPSFRGAFVSRTPQEVIADARWLAEQGVREVVLVSENSTSYGKDLGDLRLLEQLLPQLSDVSGIDRVRVSYLQPAETRPGLVTAIVASPGVADYFDLSFQHASVPVLRRMRRFGGTESFLRLLETIRAQSPTAGVRSNVIVGFPGEAEEDIAELESFLSQARLDAVGVFGYSDEDGTTAAELDGKVPEHEIRERVERISTLVEELTAQRAEDRIGGYVDVLVESVTDGWAEGRAEHQGPDDGSTHVRVVGTDPLVGSFVRALVVDSDGVDLVATVETRADSDAVGS